MYDSRFDELTTSVWAEDIYVPTVTEPRPGVGVDRLTPWLPTGNEYVPCGAERCGDSWEDKIRIVRLVGPDQTCLAVERKFWHGGWNSGGAWITLEPLSIRFFADLLAAWADRRIGHGVLRAVAKALGG